MFDRWKDGRKPGMRKRKLEVFPKKKSVLKKREARIKKKRS